MERKWGERGTWQRSDLSMMEFGALREASRALGLGAFLVPFPLPPVLLLPLTAGLPHLPQLGGPCQLARRTSHPEAEPPRPPPLERLLKMLIPSPTPDLQTELGAEKGPGTGICAFTHFPEPPFGGRELGSWSPKDLGLVSGFPAHWLSCDL